MLIDNGAEVNDKDEVSLDSLPFYLLICLVKVCTGWIESTYEGMLLWPFQHREGVN